MRRGNREKGMVRAKDCERKKWSRFMVFKGIFLLFLPS